MIDFHSHFLPGIDDGASSCEESIQILSESSRQGVDLIFATPHFYPDENTPEGFIRKRNNSFRQLHTYWTNLAFHERLPQIQLGAEVYYFPGISEADNLGQLKMGQTPFILIEPPMSPWTDFMLDEIESITSRQKLIPVIAHVDRYARILNDETVFDRLNGRKILTQVNAGFFLRESTMEFALDLLIEGNIHMMGSDAHNMSDRRQNMGTAARKIISNNCGKHLALLNQKVYNILNPLEG